MVWEAVVPGLPTTQPSDQNPDFRDMSPCQGQQAGSCGEAERYRLEIVEPVDPAWVLEPSSLRLVDHSSTLEFPRGNSSVLVWAYLWLSS